MPRSSYISKEEDFKEDVYFDGTEKDERTVKQVTWRHWMVGSVGFFYFFGFNMGLFTVSQYIYRRIQVETYPNKTFVAGLSFCAINYSNPDVLLLNDVQQKAAYWNIVFTIAAGIPSVISNIVLGSYTDRFGRKFLFILGISGTLFRMLINVLGIYINMDLKIFAVGFFIEGITGQVFAVLMAGYAYAADVTTRANRAIGIVLFEVAVGLGTTFPSIASGYFVQAEGFKWPMIVSSLFIALALLIMVLIVPESYPKEARHIEKKSCSSDLKHSVGFYFSSANAGKRLLYISAILAFFFTMMDILGRINVESLYQMNAPFCWTPQKLGIFGALRSGLQQVIGMMLIKIFKIFMTDESIAIVGAISYCSGFILEGLAKSDTVLYIVTVIGCFGLLTVPMIRSVMSTLTSYSQQGAVAASISMVETACNVFSNIMFSAIYAATVKVYAGSIFFVMAGFNVCALILLVILKISLNRHEKKTTSRIEPLSFVEKS